MLFGDLPVDLGKFDLRNDEMMFWMYCPIKLKGDTKFVVPDNLKWTFEIVYEACKNFHFYHGKLDDHYVYITAKTLFVTGNITGQRPGWHTDGFGTNDRNYIWSDREPTEFVTGRLQLDTECGEAMEQMANFAKAYHDHHGEFITYEDRRLLELSPSVIHRAPETMTPGMRTFVKISISEHRYDLIGNSINYGFPDFLPTRQREPSRNHPAPI